MTPTARSHPTTSTALPAIRPAVDTDVIAYSIEDAERVSGFSRTTIYRRIAAGELIARKAGTRTLIDAASLRACLAGLPPAVVTVKQRKAA